jgi:hypothetical protein
MQKANNHALCAVIMFDQAKILIEGGIDLDSKRQNKNSVFSGCVRLGILGVRRFRP